MIYDDRFNMSSKRAQDQVEHDYIRDSGLPRDYFKRERRIPELSDGWVAVIVITLFVVALIFGCRPG